MTTTPLVGGVLDEATAAVIGFPRCQAGGAARERADAAKRDASRHAIVGVGVNKGGLVFCGSDHTTNTLCGECGTDRPTSGGPECAECGTDRPTLGPECVTLVGD